MGKVLNNGMKVSGWILEDFKGDFVAMFDLKRLAIEHQKHLRDAYGQVTKMRYAEIEWQRNPEQK